MEIINVLKALSDETRIRILNLLRIMPLCVCEIEDILGISQSNASRHLLKLRNAKLIKSDKQMQWVYHSISEDILTKHQFLQILLDEVANHEISILDVTKLKNYKEQGGGCEHKITI